MTNEPRAWKAGELASATSLTVRTLHHYEQIGLLSPSERTEGGHRLYSELEVERLYRIRLLQCLGLSLAEISKALDDPAWDLRQALNAHLQATDKRLEAEAKLRHHLSTVLATFEETRDRQAGELLDVLVEMSALESPVQKRISIVVYKDLEKVFNFLVDVFALGAGEVERDDTGRVVHAEVYAGDGVIWMHKESPEWGLSSPATLGVSTSSLAIIVDDVDAHHAHAVEKGAEIAYAPIDQPYGYREYSARDCEGALWSFMKPIDTGGR